MSNKDDGGPAFPQPLIPFRDTAVETREVGGVEAGGMSLRDYFAAVAMQGDVSSATGMLDASEEAKWAYKMADAMLKERASS